MGFYTRISTTHITTIYLLLVLCPPPSSNKTPSSDAHPKCSRAAASALGVTILSTVTPCAVVAI